MNDLYFKVILTVIAICLILITLKPIISPTVVTAYGKEIIDVNIVEINGRAIYSSLCRPLPVEIRK